MSYNVNHLLIDLFTNFGTSGYPQSCTCVENGVTPNDCNTIFQCPCECDTLAGVCNYNCCCDPDCSSDQVNHSSTITNM